MLPWLFLITLGTPSPLAESYRQLDAAYTARDASRVMAFLSPRFVDLTGEEPKDRRATVEELRNLFGSIESARFRTRVLSASREGEDWLAVVSREGSIQPMNAAPVRRFSVYVETWQGEDGRLLLIRRHRTAFSQRISAMVARDQAVRKRIGIKPDAATVTEMQRVDDENRTLLKSLLRVHGWPRASRVGSDTAHDVWLLVQHADADRAFQRECLGQMERAMKEGEAEPSDVAYLTDRLLVADGKPQRYGTQLRTAEDGVLVFQTMETPERLNERRKAVGLPPIEDYIRLIESMYGNKVRWVKPGGDGS